MPEVERAGLRPHHLDVWYYETSVDLTKGEGRRHWRRQLGRSLGARPDVHPPRANRLRGGKRILQDIPIPQPQQLLRQLQSLAPDLTAEASRPWCAANAFVSDALGPRAADTNAIRMASESHGGDEACSVQDTDAADPPHPPPPDRRIKPGWAGSWCIEA